MVNELKPTNENIIDTISQNKINRNKYVESFLNILYSMKENYIISLDGDWGTGKTFFVKQIIEFIKCLNNESYIVDDRIKTNVENIKKNFDEKNINTKGEIFPIYFNAWEYDSNTDPLLTLIYSIIEENPKIKDVLLIDEGIKQKISKIASSFKIGVSYKGIGCEMQYNPLEKEEITKDVISVETMKGTLKELLKEIMTENSNKVIIFIDELDRCKPDFAINLLERVKHFFDDENFIFVFSTNLNDLQYTVNKFYGNGLDGYKYFDKFFDLQFSMPEADITNYIELNDFYVVTGVAKEMINIYKFPLRTINRYLSLIRLVNDFTKTNNIPFFKEYYFVLLFHIMLPFLLAIKMKDIKLYNEIVSGKGLDKSIDIIKKSIKLKEYFAESLMTFDMDKTIKFEDRFSSFYNNLFNNINSEENGKYRVAPYKKMLFEALTFINDFVKFD